MDGVDRQHPEHPLPDGAGDSRGAPPLYVFDADVLQKHFPGMYAAPPAVNEVFGRFPQAHQLFLGPAGSGAPFHFHEPAVNALLYGRKRWWFQAPGQAGYSKHPPGFGAYSSGGGVNGTAILSCIQDPGEMLFIPRLWGHSTVNLDEAVGIALEFDSLAYQMPGAP